jgi:hypothetical protein
MRTKTPPPAEEESAYEEDDWDMPEDSPKKDDGKNAKREAEKDMW